MYMIYRKKWLDKKYISFRNTRCNNLRSKLLLSFKKNYNQIYTKRLSFFIQNFYNNKDLRFYNSQNKLQCSLMYSTKVPNSKLMISRFYLINNSNSLLFGGYQK